MNLDQQEQPPYLDRDSAVGFETVFKKYFRRLHAYAFTIIKDEVMAEEMVQNVFCRLWEKAEQVSVQGSVSSYLYRAVHNESLNYLKHLKVREVYGSYREQQEEYTTDTLHQLEHDELQRRFHEALNELPEKCRTIFQLSRFEELRYHEIAARLDLPEKTVENQMGKALRLLRTKLAEFLPFWLLIFFQH